ncbi:hypothetical protein CTAYLR_000616 [Chrysophaeum taylorii]|uniref:Pseudouridine synthase RsuA/RluA-like domain-containing protein n=1 Tax=Chrysophaeum taylorii TaxID=2483200 RepID=A0AAD7U9C7_9STRA|nr:hypothetical protein CTAYLR_000616 [Chrysophaeum taylorii]
MRTAISFVFAGIIIIIIIAVLLFWFRRREATRPRRLLSHPRILRCLLPYPSARTAEVLTRAGIRAKATRRLASRLRNEGLSVPAYFYFVFNKPRGRVSQRCEVGKRWMSRTVYDALPAGFPRVAAAGRLDRDTVGLLLFTDDGSLASRLLRPDGKHSKVYEARIRGRATDDQLASLRFPLEDATANAKLPVVTTPARVERLAPDLLRIEIFEGRHHQVRRLCKRARLDLVDLERVSFGPLHLGSLAPGDARPLSDDELRACLVAAGISPGHRAQLVLPLAARVPDLTQHALDAALGEI